MVKPKVTVPLLLHFFHGNTQVGLGLETT